MESRAEERKIGRVLSLDAMRGAAALVVVMYHALGVSPQTAPGDWQLWLPTIVSAAVHFGYAGIYLFFVISGFCIHLHWARARAAGSESPTVNFFSFWQRRVRRLYPPYLCALAIYLIHDALYAPVKVTGSYLWDVGLHLLMLHNLDARTTYSINSAFWTLAIEEQLYLAYFLLLFLRIRYGWKRTLLVCAAARIGWLALGRCISMAYGVEIPVSEAAATNWFIWGLGAISVEAALGVVVLPAWCRKVWVGCTALLCAMGLAQVLPLVQKESWLHDAGWLLMHPAWGVGFFILVNRAVEVEQRWGRTLRRTPRVIVWLAAIGLISYSLYLTHLLVLMKWYWFGFTRFHIPTISLLIMTPLSVVFAWLFFRLFERPFMTPPAPAAGAQQRRQSSAHPQPTKPINEPVSA